MERTPGYLLVIKSLLLKLLVMVGREFTREIENSESRSIFDRHRDSILVQYNIYMSILMKI